MSDQRNDGGPAFPIAEWDPTDRDNFTDQRFGMTLRDYFAAKALPTAVERVGPMAPHMHAPGQHLDEWVSNVAFAAYFIADAMLVEREKPRG